MKKTFIQHIIIFSSLLWWLACAQITPLTGGEKDITPPQVLKTVPLNNSVNIHPQKIYIQFDEFIKLNNINKSFLSSPALLYSPKFKLKGKTLMIELSDTLLPNTTYTFSFGKSITDITEGNAIENFQYVFSTGKYLDSLQFSGNVYDAYTLKPDKKIYVLLYASLTDTFYNTRPAYVGLTDASGNFTIQHIKPGTYRVAALKDINNNYRYDLPTEKTGFLSTPVSLDSNISNISLRTYTTEECLPKIKSVRQLPNGAFFIEPEHIQKNDFLLTALFPQNAGLTAYTIGDSILFTISGVAPGDSISVSLSGEQLHDTISFTYALPSDSGIHIRLIKSNAILPNTRFAFTSTLPFSVDTTKVQLFNDSLPLAFSSVQTQANHWVFSTLVNSVEKYQLRFLPGAVINTYGKTNADTLLYAIKVQSPDNFGKLTVRITPGFQEDYFVVLQNTKGKEIRRTSTRSQSSTCVFEHLPPGDYSLFCIIDNNRNNIWDCGDIQHNRQPEKVIAFKNNPVKILQNWEQETQWNILP